MSLRRGFTLVELLVGLVISAIVGAALLTTFVTLFKAQASSVNMPVNQVYAQQIVTTLSNAFRDSVICGSGDSGCTVGANVESPTSTSCTVYSRNSSGTLVETNYAVVNGTFQVSVNGGTANQLYPNATLSLTYYTSSSQYATSLTSYTPTASTTSTLIAVKIVATVSSKATASATYSEGNTYTTLVRLRN